MFLVHFFIIITLPPYLIVYRICHIALELKIVRVFQEQQKEKKS
jgi:hypothetical protein